MKFHIASQWTIIINVLKDIIKLPRRTCLLHPTLSSSMRRHSDKRQDLVIGLDMATWRFMVVLTKWLMLYAWRTPWHRKQTFIHIDALWKLRYSYTNEWIVPYTHVPYNIIKLFMHHVLPFNHVLNLRVEWFFYYEIQMKA